MKARTVVAQRPSRRTLDVHGDHLVELRAGEPAIGPGAPQPLVERALLPLLGRAGGDDLLRQDVERRLGDARFFQQAAPQPAHQRRALDQRVARQREQPPLGQPAPRVARPADPLQRHRERARRLELHHQLDVADVDAQLQRGGGHHRAQLAGLELLLGAQTRLAREAAVVGRHLRGSESLLERAADALRLPAGVDEDQRAAVAAHQLGRAVEHVAPLLLRGHRRKLAARDLDGEVERPPVAQVDHRAAGSARVRVHAAGADQEAGDLLDGPLRRRQPDALRSRRAEALEPLEREREMGPTLVARHGVDLVDDHGADRLQQLASARAGEEHVERLGRGDENVRWLAQDRGALLRRRIARAHRRAEVRQREALRLGLGAQAGERLLEVAAHVVGESL